MININRLLESNNNLLRRSQCEIASLYIDYIPFRILKLNHQQVNPIYLSFFFSFHLSEAFDRIPVRKVMRQLHQWNVNGDLTLTSSIRNLQFLKTQSIEPFPFQHQH